MILSNPTKRCLKAGAVGLIAALLAIALAALLNSCAPMQKTVFVPSKFPGATFVGNHARDLPFTHTLAVTAHRRVDDWLFMPSSPVG